MERCPPCSSARPSRWAPCTRTCSGCRWAAPASTVLNGASARRWGAPPADRLAGSRRQRLALRVQVQVARDDVRLAALDLHQVVSPASSSVAHACRFTFGAGGAMLVIRWLSSIAAWSGESSAGFMCPRSKPDAPVVRAFKSLLAQLGVRHEVALVPAHRQRALLDVRRRQQVAHEGGHVLRAGPSTARMYSFTRDRPLLPSRAGRSGSSSPALSATLLSSIAPCWSGTQRRPPPAALHVLKVRAQLGPGQPAVSRPRSGPRRRATCPASRCRSVHLHRARAAGQLLLQRRALLLQRRGAEEARVVRLRSGSLQPPPPTRCHCRAARQRPRRVRRLQQLALPAALGPAVLLAAAPRWSTSSRPPGASCRRGLDRVAHLTEGSRARRNLRTDLHRPALLSPVGRGR